MRLRSHHYVLSTKYAITKVRTRAPSILRYENPFGRVNISVSVESVKTVAKLYFKACVKQIQG